MITATFLINRLPSSLLNNVSPYECLQGKLPDYSQFKSFGCLCYASTLLKNRNKFSPRALPYGFLGYPTGYKGYKLLDLESHAVFVSRNVVFHETEFPFKTSEFLNDSVDMFPNTILPMPSPLHYVDSMPLPSMHTDCSVHPLDPNTSNHTSNQPAPSSSINTESHDTGVNEVNDFRPRRTTRAPNYLSEYHCSLMPFTINSKQPTSDSPKPVYPTPYPISSVLSYENLNPSYQSYTLAYTLEREPHNFKEAMASGMWTKSVNVELVALEENRTWDVVSLPIGKNVVGCRWIFTLKFNADGNSERPKSSLVAQGYTQQEGVDYLETFSPVAKLTSVKLLHGLASAQGWSLTQMDVSNAFLHGDLDEEIYMSLPQGYTPAPGVILPPNPVCRLRKS